MRYLRRISLSLASLAALLVFANAPLAAAVDITSDVCDATANRPVVCEDARAGRSGNPLLGKDGIVTKGVQIFMMVVGVISVFVILVNATKMITANGDPNSVSKARNGLIYAAIGLAVAMTSQLIIVTVINKIR